MTGSFPRKAVRKFKGSANSHSRESWKPRLLASQNLSLSGLHLRQNRYLFGSISHVVSKSTLCFQIDDGFVSLKRSFWEEQERNLPAWNPREWPPTFGRNPATVRTSRVRLVKGIGKSRSSSLRSSPAPVSRSVHRQVLPDREISQGVPQVGRFDPIMRPG